MGGHPPAGAADGAGRYFQNADTLRLDMGIVNAATPLIRSIIDYPESYATNLNLATAKW